MRRLHLTLLLLALAACPALAETFKLYLKSGEYQITREYQREGERIRYFSTERGEWEEIPAALVDLEKTESERKSHTERALKEERSMDEEEQAERAQRKEIASIPMESGAYMKNGEQIRTLAAAEFQILTDKRRKVMQMVAPLPVVAGRASVVIKGEHASFTVNEDRPTFFLRLAKEERFGIVKLDGRKGWRVVENVSIAPVSKQSFEEKKQIATFDEQLMWNLYRVWPEKPLTAGEYALLEYSEGQTADDIEMFVWDFAVRPGAKQ